MGVSRTYAEKATLNLRATGVCAMDEATRWAKRGFYLALICGALQIVVSVATWRGWQPKWSIPPLPPLQLFLSGLCFLALAFTWITLKRYNRPSAKEELTEIYADVILFWLKENCHTVCTFATEHMAAKVALPVEKISLGLQRLQKHALIVKKPLFWEYSAISASNVSPGYGRLVGQETAARKRENELHKVIATQEQTIGQLKAAHDPLHLSAPLAALPIYLDDLRVEILALKMATTLDVAETVFFLKLSLVCDEDTGIREMGITCKINGRVFHGKPIDDLSKWVVRTPFSSREYPYKSFEDHPFEDVSLWKQLQQSGLKSGLVKDGWVGIRIPEFIPKAAVSAVRLDITKPQRREPYRFRFSEWPESEEVIYDVIFKLS